MGTTNPENGSPTPSEPAPDLTDLLVIYHQHLIDQSRLSRGADAVDTPHGNAVDSSVDDSLVEDPGLAEELAQLEDCLWQLEQLRRVESDSPTIDLRGSATDADPIQARATSVGLGERTLGRFKILRELGRGGLGVVFLAHDPVLNRHVALKIPRSESLLTPELHQRFQREAQAAARLTHPNIVPVYEIGEAGPIVYIASAYIAGQSLAEWLRAQTSPVPVATAARIVAPLADAMHYAHAQGVLHRDLKPANVLLEPTREDSSTADVEEYQFRAGKIADFGLAKLLDLASSDTRSDAIVGTPAYMSPEQAEAKQSEIGPATDIYSLGAILHELLLGSPPYRGDSDAATLVRVMQGQFSDMRKARPEITADLQAICRKCLERDPAARYPSAGELAADLHRYLRGEATVAKPLSLPQRLARWTKRNPVVAALSFVSLALLLSVAIVSTVAAIRIRSARDEAQQIAMAEAAARQRADKALLAEQAALQEAQAEKQRTAEARDAADQQAANATQISNMLLELFNTADPLGMARLGFRSPNEVGMELPLSELLSRGAKHARQSLADQPLVQATLLDTLGTVYSNLGQLAEAEPLLREAYELRQANDAREADLATSKLHLGNLLRCQGKYRDAEPLLRDCLEMRTRLLPARDLQIAEVTFALAWLLYERAGFGTLESGERESLVNQSTDLIQRTLDIQTERLGPNHRELGLTLSAAAVAKWNRGDIEGAKQALLSATNILVQQQEGERLLLAMSDVAKGTIAHKLKDFETAVQSYRNALTCGRELLGDKHIMVMMLRGELAGTLRDAGQMAEAEAILREALDHASEMFPEDHPSMVEGLQGLADIAESRGAYVESEILEQRASYCQLRWRGNWPVRAKIKTLGLKFNSGNYAEYLRLLGAGNFPYHFVLQQKSNLAAALGQHQVAEKIFRYLATHPDVYPLNGDPRSSLMLQLAATVYAIRPEDPEILALIKRYWNPNGPYPNGLEPGQCFERLAIARIMIGCKYHEEVAAEVERVLEFLRTKTIPDNWCIGYAEVVAGQLRDAQERDEEAEALLSSGLANLRRTRGEHHHITREAAETLVKFYQQHDRPAEAAPFEPLLKLPEPIEINLNLLEP